MLKKLKSFIPNRIKGQIFALIQSKAIDEFGKYKERKKFLIFLGGFYQNLGDMALTYSHKLFLKENFPDFDIITVPSTKTYRLMKTMKHICNKEDIITILGGGNMDDTYVSLEEARQFVIKNFPLNRIVSFPQTMSFSETPNGRKHLERAGKTYNGHKNLYIFTRERESLAKMKKHFKNARIGFSPDMVLYLNKAEPPKQRSGLLCCLRQDKEQKLSREEMEEIKKMLVSNYSNVLFKDTVDVTLDECSPENLDETLEKFWNTLKSMKVVITDRLHCMIFCAITKTPCVVIDNSNRKISGVYSEWLETLPYIIMTEDFNLQAILEKTNFLIEQDFSDYNFKGFKNSFHELFKACRKLEHKEGGKNER